MTININEVDKLENDSSYQKFIKDNPGTGNLKIRATSFSEALPIKGVKITISKEIGDNTIIFYEGLTDDSGMINNIKLPTPVRVSSDLEVPNFATYSLRAEYDIDGFDKIYDISLCCGVGAIQYINITPKVNMEDR